MVDPPKTAVSGDLITVNLGPRRGLPFLSSRSHPHLWVDMNLILWALTNMIRSPGPNSQEDSSQTEYFINSQMEKCNLAVLLDRCRHCPSQSLCPMSLLEIRQQILDLQLSHCKILT